MTAAKKQMVNCERDLEAARMDYRIDGASAANLKALRDAERRSADATARFKKQRTEKVAIAFAVAASGAVAAVSFGLPAWAPPLLFAGAVTIAVIAANL